MALRQHFTEHPASVGETYTEHMRVAAGFARTLALAAGAAAVHAVIPSLCTSTARRHICALHEQIVSRTPNVAESHAA